MKCATLLLTVLVSAGLCTTGRAFAGESPAPLKHDFVLADQSGKDPSFAPFMDRLRQAVRNRDKQYIEQILSPDVLTALGGVKGKQEFNRQWLELEPDSPFWPKLERVLAHGAERDPDSGEFHAPAVAFLDGTGDKPQGVVWNRHSILRKSPSDQAKPIREIYNEQVNILEPAAAEPIGSKWVKVSTFDGTIGYIRQRDIYSGFDEFATFVKTPHQIWCLSWFGYGGF